MRVVLVAEEVVDKAVDQMRTSVPATTRLTWPYSDLALTVAASLG